MEYGYNLPEVVTAEENERRLHLKGELGIRAWQIYGKLEEQYDAPIARQFSAYDHHLVTEAKRAIVPNIPGQQILPIEFSE